MFEAFAVFSFLEHWPDLNNSLRSLNSLLSSGAVGLIEVPNFEFILNKNLYSEFTVDHIYYFDRSTLKRVLELNGFEVVSFPLFFVFHRVGFRLPGFQHVEPDATPPDTASATGSPASSVVAPDCRTGLLPVSKAPS